MTADMERLLLVSVHMYMQFWENCRKLCPPYVLSRTGADKPVCQRQLGACEAIPHRRAGQHGENFVVCSMMLMTGMTGKLLCRVNFWAVSMLAYEFEWMKFSPEFEWMNDVFLLTTCLQTIAGPTPLIVGGRMAILARCDALLFYFCNRC